MIFKQLWVLQQLNVQQNSLPDNKSTNVKASK